MKKITKSSLDSIKIRVDNKINKNDVLFSDYEDMRENILFLMKENELLKEKIFDLGQTVPEDKKWENILASKLELAFFENNVTEFLEINNSINNQTYSIIIQKKFGKTPKQLLDSSEIRRVKAVKKIVALQNHIKKLDSVCANYLKQIGGFMSIVDKRFNSDEEILESRHIVQAAIDKTNILATKFNNVFIKYEAAKLHRSFTDSYHEGWRRAHDAEHRVEYLKFQLKKIKRVILQKKYPLCRIYKGKLKRK